jgi:nickel transport protein
MDLLIVTEAGPGHRGEWLLKAESYLPGGKTASAASAPAAPPTPVALGTKATVVDPPVPEEALNKALERQLAPVKEMLTELTIHRTSLTDILGGIGYIMGFFGLWAYFQTKGKKKS